MTTGADETIDVDTNQCKAFAANRSDPSVTLVGRLQTCSRAVRWRNATLRGINATDATSPAAVAIGENGRKSLSAHVLVHLLQFSIARNGLCPSVEQPHHPGADVARIRWRIAVAATVLTASVLRDAPAQVSAADSLIAMLGATQRSGVTRAELEASLVEMDKIVRSEGYSGALKDIKRAEAALIRQRLAEGDIRPGDVIRMGVPNDASLTGSFVVTPNRTIVVPSLGAIPMDGILRSEVEPHLLKHISRFLRDPVVLAEAQISIAIFGGINKEGFFVVPASAQLTEVLMQAGGGPKGSAKLDKSSIQRAGKEIVSSAAFSLALREGRTLDQLNIQAGDEIRVGDSRNRSTVTRGFAFVTGIASFAYLITRITRVI